MAFKKQKRYIRVLVERELDSYKLSNLFSFEADLRYYISDLISEFSILYLFYFYITTIDVLFSYHLHAILTFVMSAVRSLN